MILKRIKDREIINLDWVVCLSGFIVGELRGFRVVRRRFFRDCAIF